LRWTNNSPGATVRVSVFTADSAVDPRGAGVTDTAASASATRSSVQNIAFGVDCDVPLRGPATT